MENDKCFCQRCEKFHPRSHMTFTTDCHGIPFRFVCLECNEVLMAKGYDGEYYTELDEQIEDIRQVINLLGLFQNPDTDYKKGWNDGMQVVADDIKPILDRHKMSTVIETSLAERTRLVKRFKDYCISKRIDFCPTSLLGWMDSEGYLNTDKIKEAYAKEKEELGDE